MHPLFVVTFLVSPCISFLHISSILLVFFAHSSYLVSFQLQYCYMWHYPKIWNIRSSAIFSHLSISFLPTVSQVWINCISLPLVRILALSSFLCLCFPYHLIDTSETWTKAFSFILYFIFFICNCKLQIMKL